MGSGDVQVVVTDDPVAEAAGRLRDALDVHGTRLAISGGSALDVLSGLELAAWWPRVALTWVDERVVAGSEPSSNRGEAVRRANVDRAGAVLPLLRDDELTEPSRALPRVEAGLDVEFAGALDVTLLGLGEDGHVASLFPGRRWDDADARVMLVDDSPKPPPMRVTLTRSFLATARAHVVFAVGASKRDAISRLRAGDPTLPASGLEGLVVVTDPAGATR